MQTAKKILKNLKSNLWFLISLMGILALAYGTEKGMQTIVLLALIPCCVGCLFSACAFPLTKDLFTNKKAVLLAMTVEFTFLLFFYKNVTLVILQRIALVLNIPAQWLFLSLGLFFCVLGFYAAYLLSIYVLQTLHPFKVIINRHWKQILILGALFCISIFAIIRANYNYADDLGRIHVGGNLTGAFSRFIASFIATFLHSNTYLTDISPLPQLLAACILAFTAVILYAVITDNQPISFWGLLSLIPVGTFPLFLQCYSYKYDAPYMAFSVLAAIAPLVYRKKSFIKFFLAVSVGTILVCTTYQASTGIFPLVTVAVCLGMWKQNTQLKNILVFLATAVSGYVFGMIVFRFLIMDSAFSSGEYIGTTISLGAVIPNIKKYFLCIGKWFSPTWTLLVIIIAGGFILTVTRTTARNKITTLLLSLCAVMFMCALSFGSYILLEAPLFAPRGMFGFGIAIAVWCIQISVSKKQLIGHAAIALLSCCFFIFSFTYGNALNMQNEYTHLRLEQVLSDIKDLETIKGEQKITVQIVGSIGHPDQLESVFEEWPLLDALVTVQLSDSSWYWGDYELLYYSGMNDILVGSDGLDLTQFDLPVLIDHTYHTIRGNENYLLIELK